MEYDIEFDLAGQTPIVTLVRLTNFRPKTNSVILSDILVTGCVGKCTDGWKI